MELSELQKLVEGTTFDGIRNRNEQRVMHLMPEVLNEFNDFTPDALDLQDIYALVLNRLPARYVQDGNFVFSEELTNEKIRQVLRIAIGQVAERPSVEKDDELVL